MDSETQELEVKELLADLDELETQVSRTKELLVALESLEDRDVGKLERSLVTLTELWFQSMEWLLVTGALVYLAQLTRSVILWILSVVSVALFGFYWIREIPGFGHYIKVMSKHGWRGAIMALVFALFFIVTVLGVLAGLVTILIRGGVY
jgi:hypothetical protein